MSRGRARLARAARAGAVTAALVAALVGCGGPALPAQPSPGAIGATPHVTAPSGFDLRATAGRPKIASVERDGDPLGAVALALAIEPAPGVAVALGAALAARVGRALPFAVEARPARDAVRLRAAVATPAEAAAFVRAARAALAAPIARGADVDAASRAAKALRAHPLAAPVLAGVASCADDPRLAPGEAAVDPETDEGLAALERARVAANAAARASFGVVGARATLDAAAAALGEGAPWPAGVALASSAVSPVAPAIYPALTTDDAALRVDVALATADGAASAALARELAAPAGLLRRRLAATDEGAFHVASVDGVARASGGCVRVVVEASAAGPLATTRAAYVAALVRHAAASTPREVGRAAPDLGSDPREAAEAAAWWSLSAPAEPPPEAVAVAVGIRAPVARARAGPAVPTPEAEREASAAFAARVAAYDAAFRSATLDAAIRVERGQPELRALIASPCGVDDETDVDAGTTAVAVGAAAAATVADDVVVEPWITAEGVGWIVRGPRRPGESVEAHAARVGARAGAVATAAALDDGVIARARGALLGRLDRDAAHEARGLDVALARFAPGGVAWLAPTGTWEGLTRTAAKSVRSRYARLADGPWRLAVLADVDAAEGDRVAAAARPWLGPVSGRSCAVATPVELKAGAVDVALPSDAPSSRTVMLFPVSNVDSAEAARAVAETAVDVLDETGGVLDEAVAPAGAAARVEAWLARSARVSALAVDVRAPDAKLDEVASRVRAALAAIQRAGVDEAAVGRARARRDRRALEAAFDPRSRLATMLRAGAAPPSASAPPSAASASAWLGQVLREDRALVVTARPRR